MAVVTMTHKCYVTAGKWGQPCPVCPWDQLRGSGDSGTGAPCCLFIMGRAQAGAAGWCGRQGLTLMPSCKLSTSWSDPRMSLSFLEAWWRVLCVFSPRPAPLSPSLPSLPAFSFPPPLLSAPLLSQPFSPLPSPSMGQS